MAVECKGSIIQVYFQIFGSGIFNKSVNPSNWLLIRYIDNSNDSVKRSLAVETVL
jgi:hypothetical protein